MEFAQQRDTAARDDRVHATGVCRRGAPRPWLDWAVGGLLALVLGSVYAMTLHPGVGRGDSAELQYAGSLLGLCHAPGYAIAVTCAKLFAQLPIGPSAAWRINLMVAICGVTGCVSMYALVRQVTKQILPAVGAAAVLGFSSVYWANSVLAEVYVFCAMFLLLAAYAVARFVESNKSVWLYLAALLLGVAVGQRVSEVLILPAFVVLWLAYRRQARLSPARLGVSLALFALPFAYSVTFFMLRFDPAEPYARDDAERARLIEQRPPFSELSPVQRSAYATRYCLGIQWAGHGEYSPDRMRQDVNKYIWALSGLGGLGDRFDLRDPASAANRTRLEYGSSVSALGVLLALLGVWFGRRQWGWVLFGLGMFGGNTVFYLVHQPINNLNFTVPGLIGLSLLAGLGMAGRNWQTPGSAKGIVCQVACLAVPLFLLLSNWRFVDAGTAQVRERIQYCARLAKAPLPVGSVIIARRNSGMVYRYLYHVEAGRADVSVVNAESPEWPRLVERFNRQGRPTFFHAAPGNSPRRGPGVMPGEVFRADFTARLRRHTPASLAELGFLRSTMR